MTNEQILQNVNALAEKCQKSGLLTLAEAQAVIDTIVALNKLLKPEVEE